MYVLPNAVIILWLIERNALRQDINTVVSWN